MKRPVFVVLLLLALALATPARAQQDAFAAAVAGLGDGFASTAEAVEKLGATATPRPPVLRALSDGKLQRRPDGTVLVPGADGGFTDAATGAAVADAAGAEAVRINNRVRGSARQR